MMKGKKIVLGITGSIAAYKAAVLTRGLIKKGAEVQIVITPAGKEFITSITLSALTSKPVISEFFSQRDGTWHSHVDLGLWADAMVIAPATASTIGKMAHGIADNMLVTTYLSMKAPVFIAPAMDLDMFAHPSTQHNLDILRSYGNHIIEPAAGELASHLVGKGRMEEPEKIIEVLERFFAGKEDLKGRKVMITAGRRTKKSIRYVSSATILPERWDMHWQKSAPDGVQKSLSSADRSAFRFTTRTYTASMWKVLRKCIRQQLQPMQMPMQESFVLPWLTLRLNVQPTTRSNVKRKIWCCG